MINRTAEIMRDATPPSPRIYCSCPLYCKYCGRKLSKDAIGHLCHERNCPWEYGVTGCQVGSIGRRKL